MNINAIGLYEFGAPDVLQVVELTQAEPGPGQVRVRVATAAVNPTDATFRSGGRARQLEGLPLPYVPGMDLFGTIDAIGGGADQRLHIGDDVIALVLPFAGTRGAYTTSILVDQRSVVHAPQAATSAEAATVLLNGATAILALDALKLPEGEVVVVTGASGAVGAYVVAVAKKRGLVVAADSRPGEEDSVRNLGADIVVPRGEGFIAALRRFRPDGAAGLVDTASLNETALPAIADNGAIASLKGWAGPTERDIRLEAISSFGSVTDTTLLEQARDLAADGTLELRVAEVMPAERAAEAHRRLARGGLHGRLVLDMNTIR